MADHNPMGRGVAVVLQIPAEHLHFLRETFEDARDGVREELRHPKRREDPDRLRREEVAYGRLLTALDELAIVPDEDVREVAARLARIIDTSNEYERVVAEHYALASLVDQLGVGEAA